jgi:uncharacterized membrane protein YidH (DUF202 family)
MALFGGLVLIGGGIAAAVFGWQRLNSLSSRIGEIFGNPDAAGIALLAGGVIAIIAGILLLVRKR